jgi:hypothetical protein
MYEEDANANVLRSDLLPVWQRLWDSEPECLVFRFPVDPVALNISVCFQLANEKIGN